MGSNSIIKIKSFKNLISFLLVFSLLLTIAPALGTEAASVKFKYYDIAAEKTVSYSGVVPSYVINGESFDTSSQPAIINSNNIAMASASLIFNKGIGASYSYDSAAKTIKLTLGTDTMLLTIGSKTVYFNGEKKTINAAPLRIKYSSSDTYANLVPTRAVAEMFGCGYNWDSSKGVVTITSPLMLTINNEITPYTGTLGKLIIDKKEINITNTPCYLLHDTVFICISSLAKADSGIRFNFNSERGDIVISNNEIIIEMRLNSNIVSVNGLLCTTQLPPVRITNSNTSKTYVYVPAKFVLETLGYKYQWKSGAVLLTGTSSTGKYSATLPFRCIETDYEEDYYDRLLSKSENTCYKQNFVLPLPAGCNADDITVKDDLYNNLVTVTLPGNHTAFYNSIELSNSGEAILQIRFYYNETKDITTVEFTTRSNDQLLILMHEDSFTSKGLEMHFDKPVNLYETMVVIDAGHGNRLVGADDSGAIKDGIYERNLNLAMAKYCAEAFEGTSVKCILTRPDDYIVDLYDRARLADRLGASLFVSIHQNSNNSSGMSGTYVYYSTLDTATYHGYNSKMLAEKLLLNVSSAIGTKAKSTIAKDFVVIRDNQVPAVLLEVAFMSNSNDMAIIKKASNQKKVGKAIYETLMEIITNK